jgi:uncharacterized surface anchored protein
MEIQEVVMLDDITRVNISKTDITTGEEIPGAHLVLKDSDGKVVEEWDSTEEAHYIEKLPVGTYTLTETQAPDGYVIAETIAFTVMDTGEIQSFIMKDDYTKVKIHKIDASSNTELAGAKFKLEHKVVDKDGKVTYELVAEFTSTTEGNLYQYLIAGDTYRLTELEAPSGYYKASEVEFQVAATEKVQDIYVSDTRIPAPAAPEEPEDVETGDHANLILPVGLAAAAGASLVLLAKKKKAKVEEDETEE